MSRYYIFCLQYTLILSTCLNQNKGWGNAFVFDVETHFTNCPTALQWLIHRLRRWADLGPTLDSASRVVR